MIYKLNLGTGEPLEKDYTIGGTRISDVQIT